jgi:circadian clock protein KaiC
MMPQAMPELKRFLTPLGLKKHAETMVIRLVTAFVLHVTRMSAVQAAGAIQTNPCHRAQVCRCLGCKFWGKYHPLQTLQAAALACETKDGRWLFLLDQTLHSQQGHKSENTCRRGEKCVYFAFEESQAQLVRNMRSIGIDLEPWIKKGLLHFHAARPTLSGPEMHLTTMHKWISDVQPQAVVSDPISNFMAAGNSGEVKSMLIRLIDFLKGKQITTLFTNLTSGGGPAEQTDIGISSLMDTWLLLRDVELGGERNRSLYILKSRGMAHSNQLREFLLTDQGVELLDVYLGPEGVLTGSARLAQEAREEADVTARRQEIERKQRELERKKRVLDAQIAELRAEFEAQEEELRLTIGQQTARETQLSQDRVAMGQSRKADTDGSKETVLAAPKKGKQEKQGGGR